METNPLASIAKSLAIYEQDISALSRSEKLTIRNQIVVAMISNDQSNDHIVKFSLCIHYEINDQNIEFHSGRIA